MKSIEYYCGADFDPRCGQELTAAQWLRRKINAAKQLKHDLVHLGWRERDGIRINRIAKAIEDWEAQFNEIFGLEKEIE